MLYSGVSVLKKAWAVITIIALIAIFMLILFLFKNKDAEDETDEKFICTDCNENHCECHKEEPFGNK